MPYEVTSIHDNFKYIAIVPRRQLAYTIIKNLVALKLNLTQLQKIVDKSNLSSLMIVSENYFHLMVQQQPGLDMIYDSMQLHDNSRIYFHTNWTVEQNNWQLMTKQLHPLKISIKTIKGVDSPITFKHKEPI
jgi:hypothetical protein